MLEKTASILDDVESKNIVTGKSFDSVRGKDRFLSLPSQLFSPYRLIIMAALWREGELDFKKLMEDIPGISEGNLAGHLRVLEKIRMIEVNKEFVNKRPHTSFRLNDAGRQMFKLLVESLRDSFEDILDSMKEIK
ncbi:MAG: transcriptional regulator [Nitrosopumilaceae archaeon]